MHKVNRFTMYLVLVAAFLLNITLINVIKIFGVKPDILLIAAIFFATFCGVRAGFEAGLFAGVLVDIFTRGAFGINAVLFTLTAFFVGWHSHKFYKNSLPVQMGLVGFGSIFVGLAYFLLSRLLKGLPLFLNSTWLYSESVNSLRFNIFPAAIYNIVATPLIFWLLIKLFHFEEY